MSLTILGGRYALAPDPIAGGMADVYRATDLGVPSHRPVAVKVFRYGALDEEVLRESFRRETLALKELAHPNIVELLDAGTDPETKRLYVVMEWVDASLPQWLKNNPLSDWRDFYTHVGRPILTGLQFAHSRNFSHRDLKPANVLMLTSGQAKLADFGLAKLHSFMQPGVTLKEFSSKPYAPPEADAGENVFARDVYGFAVLALACLSEAPLRTRSDVEGALARFSGINKPVGVVLGSCLSERPTDRPVHAGVLLVALERIHEESELRTRPSLHLTLLRSARVTVYKEELGVVTDDQLTKAIQDDLNTACSVERYQPTGAQANDEKHFLLHGTGMTLHAKVEQTGDRLLILNLRSATPSECERNRERTCPLAFKFWLRRPGNSPDGAETIRRMEQVLAEFETQRKVVESERATQRQLDTWANLLKARSKFEESKQPPITFSAAFLVEGRVKLSVAALVPIELRGTPWEIRVPGAESIRLELDEITEGAIYLIPTSATDHLPVRGVLRADARASNQALDKQRTALDAVRLDRAVKGNLKEVLLHPESSKPPSSAGEIAFLTEDLDIAKQQAVRAALGTQDLLVVQGPPGSGKTTFIAELVLQYLARNADGRILIASQTHVAIDNAIERIKKVDSSLRLVRVAGRFSEPRVALSVRDCLVETQMGRWRESAIGGGQAFIAHWAAQRGISARDIETGRLLTTLKSLLGRQRDLRSTLGTDQAVTVESVEQVAEAEGELERESKEELRAELRQIDRELKDLGRQLVKRDELASELLKLTPEELEREIVSYIPESSEGKKVQQLLEIQADWSTRFGKTPDFTLALLLGSQVVAGTCLGIMGVRGSETIEYDLCVVDEASKGTPSELLVPLTRAHRAIVVGDERQLSPFQEPDFKKVALTGGFQLSEDDLSYRLFSDLLRRVPDPCRVALNIQHRMVEPIGRLISECFYDSALESPRVSRRTDLDQVLPKRVTWVSTSRLNNRGEQSSSSTANPCEVRQIVDLLKRAAFLLSKSSQRFSVAVLTGYSAQRMDLDRALRAEASALMLRFDIEVNTVDAFQGREADVSIYSVTRSNPEHQIGFLGETERINVALSRAREFLVIVGDHSFCRNIPGETPLKTVLGYIDRNPKSCELVEVTA